MMLCLVTDRHVRPVIEHCRDAVHAGIDLIQVREREMDGAELARLVTAVVQLTRGTATKVVVNDRLDVALACGADGVHLRGDSLPAAAARSISPPGFVIGRSVHGVDEARQAASSVNYLIAGTVFPTSSKHAPYDLLGLEGLAQICSAVPVPVLAIGGITMDCLDPVARAGAAGVAAISLFAKPGPLMTDIVRKARMFKGFDTVKPAS